MNIIKSGGNKNTNVAVKKKRKVMESNRRLAPEGKRFIENRLLLILT